VRPERWSIDDADVATFVAFDQPTRQLVLRLLGYTDPADRNHALDDLGRHPQAALLAAWLLRLPAYLNAANDGAEAEPLI
jgi:hypothetical protein